MIRVSVDDRQIVHLAGKFRAAGNQAPHAIRRALNHTGGKAKTQVTRALVAQIGGIRYGTVSRALSASRASYGALVYRIIAKGGYLSLKEFKPRQVAAGTRTSWRGQPFIPHAFMGPKPGAIARRLGGNVFLRAGAARLPIEKQLGPAIPEEMVKGQSEATFFATVDAQLPTDIEHELDAILGGHAPRG